VRLLEARLLRRKRRVEEGDARRPLDLGGELDRGVEDELLFVHRSARRRSMESTTTSIERRD